MVNNIKVFSNFFSAIFQKSLNKVIIFSLSTKSILVTSQNYGWTTDVTWTILLPFCVLNVAVEHGLIGLERHEGE